MQETEKKIIETEFGGDKDKINRETRVNSVSIQSIR